MSRCPKLRPDVVVRKLTSREESYVIVKEPARQQYYKFEAWEYDLLVKIDGTRTMEELAELLARGHPELQAGVQYVTDYVEELRSLDLLERSEQERHLVMMDKLKTLRRRHFYDSERSTLLMIQFPILDPDKLMDRILPWIRWWWSPWFAPVLVLAFAVLLMFLVAHWDLYWAGFFRLADPRGKTLLDWVGLFITVFVVSVWHELGHGFTCKRFGGEVHNIGFMLLYFQPAFYCNIDDSYLFPRLAHRIYCALGGIYFELMMCAVATGVWLLTPAEWWIHGTALVVVFFSGLSAILVNINPLIKLDGYYILMDWLDVPDLREESFGHIAGLLRKHLFHLEVPAKAISRRRRRIYLVYGALSLLYMAILMTVLFSVVRGWFVSWFGPAGHLVLLGLMAYVLRRPLRRLGSFVRHLWLDKRDVLLTRRGSLTAGLGLAALLLLVTVPRFPTRVEGSFTVEPGRRGVVRTPEGIVTHVLVHEGQRVEEGEVLAVLQNVDLVARAERARTDLDLTRREAAAARQAGDAATAEEKSALAREASARLQVLTEWIDRLTLRAPLAGLVATHRLMDTLGKHLDAGESFCEVDDLRTVRLVVALPEPEIEEVREGVPVRVLPTARPERTIESTVLSIAPAAYPPEEGRALVDLVRRSHLVRVQVEVKNEERILRPGMTGRIQLLTRPRSVVGKLWWRLGRWTASVFW